MSTSIPEIDEQQLAADEFEQAVDTPTTRRCSVCGGSGALGQAYGEPYWFCAACGHGEPAENLAAN